MNKPTYKLSPSSINLMLDCPRMFLAPVGQKSKETRYAFSKLTFWDGQSPKGTF